MSEVYEKLMKCYKSVREKTDFVPEAALILGSGLGDYADDLKIEASINYADIEGFPVSTVKGHKGKICVCPCGGRSYGDHAGTCALL